MYLDEDKDLSKKPSGAPGLDDDAGEDGEDNEEDLDSWELEADLEE